MGNCKKSFAWGAAAAGLLSLLAGPLFSAESAVPNPASVPAPQPLDCAVIEAIVASPEDYTILDARSPSEYDSSHVPGALNVPYDSVPAYADLLPADKARPIVTYCRSGRRATVLQGILSDMGYTNISVVPGEQMQHNKTSQSFRCGD